MRARIIIALDGSMAVFVDEGTPEEAAALSQRIYQVIGQTVPIASLSEPEQHRHAAQHVHTHAHTEVHDHTH
jgi:hypothetical protein